MYRSDFKSYAETIKANSEDVKARLNVLEYEFTYKLEHDFRRYLFLGVIPNKAVSLEDVLKDEIQHEGYERHKIVKYHAENGEKIIHLYLKYRTCADVLAVQRKYREEKSNYYAEVVADILKGWYSYEIMCVIPGETFGVLDIVGQAQFNNPLSKEIAYNTLKQFGDFRIVNVAKDKVKVGFHSMAEGIAACIALGEWFVKSEPQDQKFYYRVLLDKSDHFSELVNKCNNTTKPTDAFNLDYFVPADPASILPPVIVDESYIAPGKLQNSQRTKTKSDSAEALPATYENTNQGSNYLRISNRGRKRGCPNQRIFRQRFPYCRNTHANYHPTYVNPHNFTYQSPNVQYFPNSNVSNGQSSYL